MILATNDTYGYIGKENCASNIKKTGKSCKSSLTKPNMEGYNGHPLSSWEKQGNRTRARTRSRIEHVFGSMTQRAGNLILRTIGINRAEVKLGLRNIAYNMERFCFLMRQTA